MNKAITKRDRKTLESEGWEIISETPPIIREKITGSTATKFAVLMVIAYLQQLKKAKRERKVKSERKTI